MDFATALEKAITVGKRNALGLALTISVPSILIAIVTWNLPVDGEFPFVALVIGVCIWPVAFAGTSGTRAMEELRGAQPEHWLPSPTHGVVVLTAEHLLAGDLRAELNRHARRRITSVAYDDTDHSLVVALLSVRQTNDGEREDQRQISVKLDPSVPAERAFAFAKHALELSQR